MLDESGRGVYVGLVDGTEDEEYSAGFSWLLLLMDQEISQMTNFVKQMPC